MRQHGHGPQRAIQTGVGPVEVRRAKVRDRADVAAEEKIRFTGSPAISSSPRRASSVLLTLASGGRPQRYAMIAKPLWRRLSHCSKLPRCGIGLLSTQEPLNCRTQYTEMVTSDSFD
jgi:hypothetical protein